MANGSAAAAKERKPTKYVVLRQHEGVAPDTADPENTEFWTPVLTVDAKNADEAEKKAAKELGPGDGLYAEGAYKAVAASSWDGGQYLFNETNPQPKSRPLNGASIEQRAEEGATV